MSKLDTLNRNLSRVKVTPKTEGVKYKAESRLLRELVSEDVLDLLVRYKVFVAGGAVTSVFTNRDVNDLDVYFRSELDMLKAMSEVMLRSDSDMAAYSLVFTNVSARTIMLKDSKTGQEVQFMTFKYFKSPEELFNTFDFTCCMGCYCVSSDSFHLHPDFLKHNSQGYLKFNSGTAYPIMSLLRVDKYREKGYTVSKPELLRIVFQCMSLKLETWEEAIDHMAGMYGYDMSDVFDQEEEFSCESLVTQLDDINEREIQKYITSESDMSEYYQIVGAVVDLPDNEVEAQDPKFDTSKYYYKCVNSEWESPLSSNKIHYKEGDVISGKGPIYVHKDPWYPYHNSRYWVELEIASGCKVNESTWGSETTLHGDVKVVRTFKYTLPSTSIEQQTVMSRLYTKYPEMRTFLDE